ncbi:MAG: calcium-binding protein [Deltaproteobacteria bacterium]|nr:calcium-binding protein [Deltaproteobacteria bacterium]
MISFVPMEHAPSRLESVRQSHPHPGTNHLNQNGELDIDSYSDQFIEDRAVFLYALTHKDENHFTEFDTGFIDDTLNINADVKGSSIVPGGIPNLYEWGNGDDPVDGGGGDDHLYGTTGNDYLEGGKGDDTFGVYGPDSGIDTFSGGDDYDRIIGGAGDDAIRVRDFRGDNTVEEIDGKGGHDTIIGGDSGVTLHGGTGNVTLTGGTGKDKLHGDADNACSRAPKPNYTNHQKAFDVSRRRDYYPTANSLMRVFAAGGGP